MAKYSKTAQKKVEKTMHGPESGTVRSGSGKRIASRKQAIAIGLSKPRKKGTKVPKKAPKKTGGKTSARKSSG